jgi:hypothetical protein
MANSACAIHQHRRGDAGQRHHRGDREVDAAGNHHHGLGGDREGEGQGGETRPTMPRTVAWLDDPRQDEERREQNEQPDDPGVPPDEAAHGAAPIVVAAGAGIAAPRGRP